MRKSNIHNTWDNKWVLNIAAQFVYAVHGESGANAAAVHPLTRIHDLHSSEWQYNRRRGTLKSRWSGKRLERAKT